jgi:hypothetical protein
MIRSTRHLLLALAPPRFRRGGIESRIVHEPNLEFTDISSWSSSLTVNPHQSLEVGPVCGPTLWILPFSGLVYSLSLIRPVVWRLRAAFKLNLVYSLLYPAGSGVSGRHRGLRGCVLYRGRRQVRPEARLARAAGGQVARVLIGLYNTLPPRRHFRKHIIIEKPSSTLQLLDGGGGASVAKN